MLTRKLRKRQILPVNQNRSSVYFSVAKFQLMSRNLSPAMISQITYTHKLPKLCSGTLSWSIVVGKQIKSQSTKAYHRQSENFVIRSGLKHAYQSLLSKIYDDKSQVKASCSLQIKWK